MDDRSSPSLVAPALIVGLLLSAGLVLGGAVLGMQIKAIRLADRYVTVKGLVERTVKSDTAVWSMSFSETGDDLAAVFARSESDRAGIQSFFAAQGFAASEFTTGAIHVVDRSANQYSSNNGHVSRYIVTRSVALQTHDVDRVSTSSGKTADLVKSGIVLSSDSVAYIFTGLNALKPDMITEATRNARASANRFAADSGSEVGSIRSANQGVFSITGADVAAPSSDEEGAAASSDETSIMKKVRVVSTIDYYLVK